MPVAPEQQRESRYDLALTAGEASAANLWAGGGENQGRRRSRPPMLSLQMCLLDSKLV